MSTSGKRVYNKLYIHVSAVNTLDGTNASLLSEAAGLAKLSIDSDFNVARLSEDHHDVALLDYPRFLEDAFPALARSWRVHMPSGHVGFRDYRQSLNPPILHRKELLLPKDHPGHTHFAGVTRLAESIGLFDDTRSIGFLVPWATLVSNKGYRIEGAELLPIGNSEASIGSSIAAPIVEADEIQRHLTALTRTSLSAPVQSLLRHGLLRGDTSFFDYGCGKGDDLAGLASMGVTGGGWDPYYRPDAVRVEADVVNVGFVINVIEDFDERAEALTIAFSLCRQVMAVSAMLQSTGYSGRSYRDGVLTGRNTFQKYYSQTELQQFIETVVDESAIAAAPGVFYVFKDRGVENHFYSRRTVSRTRALRAALPPQPPRVPRIPTSTDRPVPAPDPRLLDAVSGLWQQSLELGRAPDLDEIEAPGRLTEAFGSIGRAVNYCNRWKDAAALERSGAARRDELRVFFALQVFSKRRKFQDYDRSMQRDVKVFFGSLANAEAEGQCLLYSTRDVAQIATACEEAAALGLGWLEQGQALHLHTSLVERLAPILRVYVGCATVMFGDITQQDLVKLHLRSGKVTLMRFDDFSSKPLPVMTERVKVRLRDQEVDIFCYGGDYPPPLLYNKSRFINEEFANYAEQCAFDEALRSLNLFDLSGYGPAAAEFRRVLSCSRWSIEGFRLIRASDIPNIDEQCSEHFTYRQLIECSDTFKHSETTNVPQRPETFVALADLARFILEPIVEYFGAIKLTYGFCSSSLATAIGKWGKGIAPQLDQHAGHELNRNGQLICSRGGAAVDFIVTDEDMGEVANWIIENTPFDRLYFYGADRPLHVSYSAEPSGLSYAILLKDGRRIPKPQSRF